MPRTTISSRCIACLIVFFLVVVPQWGLAGEAAYLERLRARIEALAIPETTGLAAGTRLTSPARIVAHYQAHGFAPLWTAEGGDAHAERLIDALETLRGDGLNPNDYHLAALREAGDANGDVGARIDLELLASDALLLAARHLASGKVDPVTLYATWRRGERGMDAGVVLERVREGDPVAEALAAVRPSIPAYGQLRQRLGEIRGIAHSEPAPVATGSALRAGMSDPRIADLRERLRWLGDLDAAAQTQPEQFDTPLLAALDRFQERHGLDRDGVVGRDTLTALNMTADQRIQRLRANLERWRWLPESLGERHIRVNIAAFSMTLAEPGEEDLEMRAVVGRDYRQTPVFSASMTYLVFNPTWNVPASIARRDLLPRLQKEPEVMASQGFYAADGWGESRTVLQPEAVDWHRYDSGNLPLNLHQRPGPDNALGRVKFMFPNRFSVYLHDTPSVNLFSQPRRAFSSGCVRLQQPLQLAERLLAGQFAQPHAAIATMLEAGQERTVTLDRPIDVHLLYFTVFEENGRLHWRDDIYRRTPPLLEALDACRDCAPTSGRPTTSSGERS